MVEFELEWATFARHTRVASRATLRRAGGCASALCRHPNPASYLSLPCFRLTPSQQSRVVVSKSAGSFIILFILAHTSLHRVFTFNLDDGDRNVPIEFCWSFCIFTPHTFSAPAECWLLLLLYPVMSCRDLMHRISTARKQLTLLWAA